MLKGQHICVFHKSVNRNPVCLAGEDGWGRQTLAPRTASSVTVAKGSKEMPKRPSGETYLPYTWSSHKKVWGKQWKDQELPRLQMPMSAGRLNLLSTLRAKETFPFAVCCLQFLNPWTRKESREEVKRMRLRGDLQLGCFGSCEFIGANDSEQFWTLGGVHVSTACPAFGTDNRALAGTAVLIIRWRVPCLSQWLPSRWEGDRTFNWWSLWCGFSWFHKWLNWTSSKGEKS